MSKYFRKLVLKKLFKYYNLSAGFFSVKYWTNKIEKNVFDLIQAIHDEIIFDFEENYEQLIKRFRHMSLFSVCLHFLRCRRSCEKKAGYFKFCSRVRENCFYDLDKFSNLIVRSDVDDFLPICSAERLHLDIFLNRSAYFQYPDYDLINGKCCGLEVFSFGQDCLLSFLLFL